MNHHNARPERARQQACARTDCGAFEGDTHRYRRWPDGRTLLRVDGRAGIRIKTSAIASTAMAPLGACTEDTPTYRHWTWAGALPLNSRRHRNPQKSVARVMVDAGVWTMLIILIVPCTYSIGGARQRLILYNHQFLDAHWDRRHAGAKPEDLSP